MNHLLKYDPTVHVADLFKVKDHVFLSKFSWNTNSFIGYISHDNVDHMLKMKSRIVSRHFEPSPKN